MVKGTSELAVSKAHWPLAPEVWVRFPARGTFLDGGCMLFDAGDRDAPGIGRYERREITPKEERCNYCDGLGLVRWRHSWDGPDYKVCHSCRDTGRKDKKNV